jgi:S1-C subfamily serine protease
MAIVAAWPLATHASGNTQTMAWCFDVERDIVQRSTPGACHGQVLTPGEAERLRADIAERRVSRFRAQRPGPTPGGADRAGSGFRVARTSFVLTAQHVIERCAALTVQERDGTLQRATPVATHPAADVALLRASPGVRGSLVPEPDGDSNTPRAVRIVGYAPGDGAAPRTIPGRLVTPKRAGGADSIFVDAALRPGTSGAPIVAADGRLVGMVTGRFATSSRAAARPEAGQGAGVGLARRLLTRFLAERGMTERPLKRPGPVVRVLCALPPSPGR